MMCKRIEEYFEKFSDDAEEIDVIFMSYYLPDLSRFHKLKRLICSLNKLRSLPTLPSTLEILDCSNNQMTAINLQPVGLLESLKADFNPLQNVNLEFVSNLSTLSLQSCQLTGLDLNLVPDLIYLKIFQLVHLILDMLL